MIRYLPYIIAIIGIACLVKCHVAAIDPPRIFRIGRKQFRSAARKPQKRWRFCTGVG
jgi:hypothetical protein